MKELEALKLKNIYNIEGVRFFRRTDGEEVHPRDFFDEYSVLEELIELNRKAVYSRKRMAQTPVDPRIQEDEERNHLASEARAKLEQADYAAEIDYGSKKETLDVRLRTNFDDDLLKKPTIVQISRRSFPMLILREARTYSLNDLVPFRKMDRRTKELYKEGELEENRLNIIPEPTLIKSLEALYSKGYPRFTVPLKILFDEGEKLYYIRPFVGTSLRDVSFNVEEAAKYLGIVHSYGLHERFDRTPEQYVMYPPDAEDLPKEESGSRTLIRNIDPEFFVFSTKPQFLPKDEENFLNVMDSIYPIFNSEENKKRVREIYRRVRNLYSWNSKALAIELKRLLG